MYSFSRINPTLITTKGNMQRVICRIALIYMYSTKNHINIIFQSNPIIVLPKHLRNIQEDLISIVIMRSMIIWHLIKSLIHKTFQVIQQTKRKSIGPKTSTSKQKYQIYPTIRIKFNLCWKS